MGFKPIIRNSYTAMQIQAIGNERFNRKRRLNLSAVEAGR